EDPLAPRLAVVEVRLERAAGAEAAGLFPRLEDLARADLAAAGRRLVFLLPDRCHAVLLSSCRPDDTKSTARRTVAASRRIRRWPRPLLVASAASGHAAAM